MSMMIDFLGYDPTTSPAIESLGKAELLPAGMYTGAALSAQLKETKSDPDCRYWLLLFAVADEGDFNGRVLPVRFNTNHSDPEVAELGRGQLHHYLKCIGNLNPKCPDDLCGITVSLTVVIRKGNFKDRNGKDRDGEYNEVTRINACLPGSHSKHAKAEA